MTIFSQDASFKRIQIEVLDEMQKRFRRFNGESEVLQINLIRKTETAGKKTISERGLSIEIRSRQTSNLISNSGLTIPADPDFIPSQAGSGFLIARRGSIFLNAAKSQQLRDFLNETLPLSSTQPGHDTGWALEIDQRFVIALIYEKRGVVKWKYFLQLDDAEFEIPFDKGLDLMRELAPFFEQLEES